MYKLIFYVPLVRDTRVVEISVSSAPTIHDILLVLLGIQLNIYFLKTIYHLFGIDVLLFLVNFECSFESPFQCAERLFYFCSWDTKLPHWGSQFKVLLKPLSRLCSIPRKHSNIKWFRHDHKFDLEVAKYVCEMTSRRCNARWRAMGIIRREWI